MTTSAAPAFALFEMLGFQTGHDLERYCMTAEHGRFADLYQKALGSMSAQAIHCLPADYGTEDRLIAVKAMLLYVGQECCDTSDYGIDDLLKWADEEPLAVLDFGLHLYVKYYKDVYIKAGLNDDSVSEWEYEVNIRRLQAENDQRNN